VRRSFSITTFSVAIVSALLVGSFGASTPAFASAVSASVVNGDTVTLTGQITQIADAPAASADSRKKLFKVSGGSFVGVDFSAVDVDITSSASLAVQVVAPDGVDLSGDVLADVLALQQYNLESGSLVAVSATPILTPDTAPMINLSPVTAAEHKVYAVLVTPSNVAGNVPEASQTAPNVAIGVAAADSYWGEQSSGKIGFSLVGTVPWYKSTKSCVTTGAAGAGTSTDLWIEAAIKANEQLGYNGAANSHLVLFIPSTVTTQCDGALGLGGVGGSVNSGGWVWTTGTTSPISISTLRHELGHNLSLGHANWAECTGSDPHPGLSGTAGCITHDYGDISDVMGFAVTGKSGGALSSPSAIRAGIWPTSSYQVAPAGTTTYTLQAVSSNAGLRSVIVEDNLGSNYFVEFRNFTDEDAQYAASGCTANPSWCVQSAAGVRILRISTAGSNFYKGLPGQDTLLIGRDAAGTDKVHYTTGQSFNSMSSGGATITVTGMTATEATIQVSKPVNAIFSDTIQMYQSLSYDDSLRVGDVLTGYLGSWWTADSYSFKWYRNGTAISGATKQSYTVTSADKGKYIRVTVTGKIGSSTRTMSSPSTIYTGYGPIAAGVLDQGTVSISNAASKLQAVPSDWTLGSSFSYKWLRNGVAISGATASTYSPGSSDRGTLLSVKVTASKSGYASLTATSAAKDYTVNTVGSFAITGTAQVGQTLSVNTVSYTTVDGAVASPIRTYQWYRSGTAISGATAQTYQLAASDVGKTMTVKVTGGQIGYISHSATAPATSPVIKGTLAGSLALPSVTSSPTGLLTAVITAGSMTESGLTKTSYQWYRGATAITGATKPTYQLTSTSYGKELKVRITFTKTGYNTVTLYSPLVNYSVVPSAAKPVITGTVAVGQTIGIGSLTYTGPSGDITGSVTNSYKWYRDGSAISGATASTYVLTSADKGKAITVKVTAVASGLLTWSATSLATQKVGTFALAGENAQPNVTVTKDGATTKLSVASTGITELGTAQTYQWYRNGATITGATASSYTATSTSFNKVLTVRVTTKKTNFTSNVKYSAGYNVSVIAAGVPTISDTTPQVGNTLTATAPSYSTATGAITPQLSYQWYRNGSAISGATASTYLVTSGSLGKAITVKVTAVQPGWLTSAVLSAKTTKVAG
jgi:hypothetical protein